MKAIVNALQEYERDIEEWVKRGVSETVLTIHATAVSLAPTDTSHLKDSIRYKIMDGGLRGVVNVGADYAMYVEFGTGIYAKGPSGSTAKKLPWSYRRYDGAWVTTYGNEAQPFWYPALDAGEAYFNSYFSE